MMNRLEAHHPPTTGHRNRAHARTLARYLALAVIAGLAMTVAACKEKAPPPPPPPPPPAPVPVSFDTIKAELKVDPRVSQKDGLEITDRSFAEACLKLADAFARGDDAKASGLLNDRAKRVLSELVNSGQWAEQTKAVEAVRIVFAAVPGELSDMERDRAIQQMTQQIDGEVKRFYERMLFRGASAEEAQRYTDSFKATLERQLADIKAGRGSGLGLSSIEELILQSQRSDAITADTKALVAAGDRPDMVMLMSVQTPAGSDLLGWTARRSGDNWIFANASTVPFQRSRATDWDPIGMFGFSLNTGKELPPEKAKVEGAGVAGGTGSGPKPPGGPGATPGPAPGSPGGPPSTMPPVSPR